MARFYFHLVNGEEFAHDEEGLDLPDAAAAIAQAGVGLRDVLAGDLLNGQLNTASFIDVEDSRHQRVARVTFTDVVSLTNKEAVRPTRLKVVPPPHDASS